MAVKEAEQRLCRKCRILKPTDQFSKKSGRGDGLQTWCKECVKKRNEQFRSDNLGYLEIYRRKNRNAIITVLGGRCLDPDCMVDGGCSDMRCLQIEFIKPSPKFWLRFGSTSNMIRYYAEHTDEAAQQLTLVCANCKAIRKYGPLVV